MRRWWGLEAFARADRFFFLVFVVGAVPSAFCSVLAAFGSLPPPDVRPCFVFCAAGSPPVRTADVCLATSAARAACRLSSVSKRAWSAATSSLVAFSRSDAAQHRAYKHRYAMDGHARATHWHWGRRT